MDTINKAAQLLGTGDLSLHEYLVVAAIVAGEINQRPVNYSVVSEITGLSLRGQRRLVARLEQLRLLQRVKVRGATVLRVVQAQEVLQEAVQTKARVRVEVPDAWHKKINSGKRKFPRKTYTAKQEDLERLQVLLAGSPGEINNASWKALQEKAKCPLSYLATFVDANGAIKAANKTQQVPKVPAQTEKQEFKTCQETAQKMFQDLAEILH